MSQATPKTRDVQHPAHQGHRALRFWRPDPLWYHPPLCALVVRLSQLVMQGLNSVTFEGRERWDALFGEAGASWSREGGRGLLSVSNHVSLFDDPLLISNLGATSYADVRWIAADHKNFFGSNLKGLIFSAGKCVPLIRGDGLDQPGFDFLRERLKEGDWVHLFPEGGRTRREAGLLKRPLKVGVGRLIYEASPVVMPFYHYGMHEVMPVGAVLPRRGHHVKVRFGSSSVIDDSWWVARYADEGLDTSREPMDERASWAVATRWVERQLLELERQVNPLATDASITSTHTSNT